MEEVVQRVAVACDDLGGLKAAGLLLRFDRLCTAGGERRDTAETIWKNLVKCVRPFGVCLCAFTISTFITDLFMRLFLFFVRKRYL